MSSPGGAELARVNVRVVPDTSRFRQELKKTLDAIERTTRLEIGVDADTAGVRSRVNAALSGMSAKVRIDADTAGLRQRVNSAVTGMTARLRIDGDTTQARAAVDRLVASINSRTATIKVDADTAGALARVETLIQQINGRTAEVKVRADDSALRRLTGSLGGVSSGFAQAGGAASGFGSTLGSVASSTLGVVGSVAKLTTIAGAVTYAVGGAGAAILALPAATAGAAAGIGVLALGFQGFGDAIKEAKTPEEIKKQQEALAKLAPAARDTAIAFNQSMRPALEGLKKAIQQPLFAGLDKTMRAVAATVTSTLQPGLVTVAGTMNTFIKSLAGLITGEEGSKRLAAALAGANTVLAGLLPATSNLVREFLNLAGVPPIAQSVSNILGGLVQKTADWLAEMQRTNQAVPAVQALETAVGAIGTAFFDALTGAVGFFTRATPGVSTLVTEVGQLAEQLLPSLGGAFGAAAGAAGTLLDKIPQSTWDAIKGAVERLAQKFQELGNNPQVQELFNRIALALPGLIDDFGRLVDIAMGVVKAFDGLNYSFAKFQQGLGRATPAQEELIRSFERTPDAVAAAEQPFANFGVQILKTGDAAATAGQRIVNGITIPMNALPGITQQQIDALNPVLKDGLAKAVDGGVVEFLRLPPEVQAALTPLPQTAAAAVAPTGPAVGASLAPTVQNAQQQGVLTKLGFTNPLLGLPSAAGAAAAPAPPAVGAALAPAGPAAGQAGALAAAGFVDPLRGIPGLGAAAVQPTGPAIAGALGQGGAPVGAAGQTVGQAGAAGIGTGLAGAPAAATAGMAGVPPALQAAAPAAGAAGGAVGAAVPTGMKPPLDTLPQLTSDSARAAIGPFEQAVPSFQQAGLNLALGVARGIESGQSAVINAVIRLAQMAIQQAQQSLQIRSPSKVAEREVGYQVSAGVAAGITSGTPLAVKSVISMSDQVVSTLNAVDYAGLGVSAGSDLAAGVRQGLEARLSAADAVTASVKTAVAASTPPADAGSSKAAGGGGGLSASDAAVLADAMTEAMTRKGMDVITIAKTLNAANDRLSRR